MPISGRFSRREVHQDASQILGGTVRAGSIYASAPAQVEIGDGIRRAVLELTGGNYFSSGRIIIASNSVVAGRGSDRWLHKQWHVRNAARHHCDHERISPGQFRVRCLDFCVRACDWPLVD